MHNDHIDLSKKKTLIWDWNGTLLNDVDACHRSLCQVLAENGLPEISLIKHRDMFRFPILEFYLDLGFDFSRVSYEDLCDRYHVLFREEVKNASLFENASDFLNKTKEHGITHYILSVCHQDDLAKQVNDFGVAHHFKAFYGQANLLAHCKISRGKQLMEDFGINRGEAVFIGDTDHDLEVGQALGIDTLLVAQGHQSYERLILKHDDVLQSSLFV